MKYGVCYCLQIRLEQPLSSNVEWDSFMKLKCGHLREDTRIRVNTRTHILYDNYPRTPFIITAYTVYLLYKMSLKCGYFHFVILCCSIIFKIDSQCLMEVCKMKNCNLL